MSFVPRRPPSNPDEMPGFLFAEHNAIAAELAKPVMQLQMLYAAPDKPRDGLIVLADGTNWNPGAGAGFYGYRAGSWRFLG